jgi:thiopurine S-methyltransferase
MIWLHERGSRVIGTELSQIAVESFFSENNLKPSRKTTATFNHYTTKGIDILCGDHFTLKRTDLNGALAVYDRAALVALPPHLRRRYADQLTQLLLPDSRVLLISYDYNQNEICGPPFAVPLSEINSLFSSGFEIEILHQEDTLGTHQGLKARGVTKLIEFVCLLTRRTSEH